MIDITAYGGMEIAYELTAAFNNLQAGISNGVGEIIDVGQPQADAKTVLKIIVHSMIDSILILQDPSRKSANYRSLSSVHNF
jgi:hypothetical protein